MIWAAGIQPCQLREIYWANSYAELKKMVDLKFQHLMATSLQELEHWRLVVSEVFGSGEAEAPKDEVTSEADLMSLMQSINGA